MEKFAFGYGTSRRGDEGPDHSGASGSAAPPPAGTSPSVAAPPRRDWAFLGLMAFTALLFFRPQDVVTPLRLLHVAEIAAIVALGAMVFGRVRRGLPLVRVTAELAGVLAFAAIILLTAPFSVWTGGAVGTFTELYAKVVLIFVLMVNTLTSPRRIEQFTWLIVIASGYISARAVFDYARGINLIENGRVQGAVGGMFKNPNDLALNMVAVLPLAVCFVLRPLPLARRTLAAVCCLLMLATVVASQSRSGTVGLAAMAVVLAACLVRRNPGVILAAALAGTLALPLLPASYWERLASITDENLDQTGSREARSTLLRESFEAFAAHPLTGVGAGQFKVYNPEGREQPWRESHNVVLQVASELGVFGLMVFAFLLGRAAYAPIQTRRLLRRLRSGARSESPPVSPADDEMLTLHSAALIAALVGWFVCALFASVAYHWTFYYLLALAAAPREYLQGRLSATRAPARVSAFGGAAPAGVQA